MAKTFKFRAKIEDINRMKLIAVSNSMTCSDVIRVALMRLSRELGLETGSVEDFLKKG